MFQIRRVIRAAGPVIALACLLMAALAGCGGSDEAAATCPVPTAFPVTTPSSTATLPPGWTTYTDQHYGFRLPVPPGWHAGTTQNNNYPLEEDIVMLLAPCVHAAFDNDTLTKQNDVIWLAVSLSPGNEDETIQDEPGLTPEPTKASVGGVSATVYDDPGGNDPDVHETVVRFGDHPYLFFMKSTADATSGYLPVYLTVMQYFVYTGASA